MNDTEEPHTPSTGIVKGAYQNCRYEFNDFGTEVSGPEFDRWLEQTIADAHRAGREAMREEAAQAVEGRATRVSTTSLVRAGIQTGIATAVEIIRALPLAPVGATSPATECDHTYECRADKHTICWSVQPDFWCCEDCKKRWEIRTGNRATSPMYEAPTPRPEFGPTPREGDES